MEIRKRIRRASLYVVARTLLAVVGRLPRGPAHALFDAFGRLAHALFRGERRKVLDHMAIAFPERSAAERRRLARDMFVDLARNAGDVARALQRDPRELLDLIEPPIQGEEQMLRAIAGGRGVVAVTGHLGAWELFAAYYVQRGYRLCVVARPMRSPRYQPFIDRLRSHHGIEVFHEGDGMRPLIRAVREGAAVGILFDQFRDPHGMWVPFFGRPAWTPLGPAELARLGRVALLPMGVHRVGKRHRILLGEPIEPDWREPGAIEEAMRACSRTLEGWIRRYPTQWVWMYNRWAGPRKTDGAPDGAEGVDGDDDEVSRG